MDKGRRANDKRDGRRELFQKERVPGFEEERIPGFKEERAIGRDQNGAGAAKQQKKRHR